MRCLRFQQLHIPIQRSCKLPLWTIGLIILIIHLIKGTTIFQQNMYLQLPLPVKLAPPLYACSYDRICTVSLLMQFSHRSVTCLMYVHDLQVTDHVSTCCWPTPQNALATSLQVSWGKKIIRRGQRLHCNNSFPLCPLRHIIHNPHITNGHESSHSRHV